VSAVGHYLEEEGIATTLISLVREHTEIMRPPRALWVPFMLGRPLGAPGEALFQRKVLRALLSLLEEPAGPVLRDFPEDAPGSIRAETGDACPVKLRRPPVRAEGEQAMAQSLRLEIAELRPWFELARRKRGCSTFGVSGLTPEQAGDFVVAMIDAGAMPDHAPGLPLAQTLKLACDDLRAFYEEAGSAQPGQLTASELERWYYLDTVAGQMLDRLQKRCLASDDEALQHLGKRVLIPRAIVHGTS
jgi:hypothetical protein